MRRGRRAGLHGLFTSAGLAVRRSPFEIAGCGLTLLSLVVYAVVRRRRRSASTTASQDSEHSPLATEDESDAVGTAEGDEDEDDTTSDTDERESVSERKALTGLV